MDSLREELLLICLLAIKVVFIGPFKRKACGLDAEIEESGLPCRLSGKESSCQCRRHWFNP